VDAVGTHVRQFVGRVERLLGFARVQVLGEEVGQRDRDAIQHLLQRADRGADLVLLDQRDRAVGDAHATGQLALAEATGRAYPLQACADVHPRRSAPLPGAPACCRILYMAPRDGQFFGIDSGPALNLSNGPACPGACPAYPNGAGACVVPPPRPPLARPARARPPRRRWTPAGCRAPPAASAGAVRACCPRPRACTTATSSAARSWMGPPACGAAAPAMRARASSRRSRARPRPWISPRISRWARRCRSNWPGG